ncbi:hypothetical protein D020_4310 [Vibrio parahaemolyticus SBR10290]|nr:hypothetical protein D020_4310 [Vibrio parahaemolyticus SBR10290]
MFPPGTYSDAVVVLEMAISESETFSTFSALTVSVTFAL